MSNYSTITAPLTSMTKGVKRKIPWNSTAKTAFQKLKEAFTTAPILKHTISEAQFIIEVDSSDFRS